MRCEQIERERRQRARENGLAAPVRGLDNRHR